MSALSKALSSELHPTALVLLRNAGALILTLPALIKHRPEIGNLVFSKLIWQRALLSQIAVTCWFMGLSLVDLSPAMAMSFLTPLFTTFAAVVFLGEIIDKRVWVGLFIGFFGVLIILNPFQAAVSLTGYAWVFGAVLCWSLAHVVIKKLSTSVTPLVILFFMMSMMTLFSLPLGILNWKTPLSGQYLQIALLALSAFFWQWYLVKAMMHNQLSALQPFDFSKLIFASVIGYFVFNELLSFQLFAGSFLILVSAFYIAWQGKTKNCEGGGKC